MKRISTFLLFVALAGLHHVCAQDNKVYSTSMLEIQLSWANVTMNGEELGGPVRFSPFFNLSDYINVDLSDKTGLFSGLAIRNVGFIYDVDENTRIKARTYNLGIPFGVKIGQLDKAFIYAGYEIEFPINYKEKTFINEQKTKFNKWFSERTVIQHALMVGIQLPYGSNLKFKYYLSNFYKKSYSESDGNGGTVKPYENMDVNVMYISLNIYLLRNTDLYY